MNIMIGKFGRSIPFNPASWSMFKGDAMPSHIYLQLAASHPEDTFYLFGASDFTKYKEETDSPFSDVHLPDNIIDLHHLAREELGEKYLLKEKNYTTKMLYKTPGKEPWRMVEEYVKIHDIKLDFGILMQGPDARVSIMGERIPTAKGETDKECQALMMAANYIAPIRHVLNSTMIPWVNIVDDPRYVPTQDVDVLNRPKAVLSMCNLDLKRKFMDYYTQNPAEYKEYDVLYRYIDMCKFQFASKTKYDYRNGSVTVGKKSYKKDLGMMIACNDGNGRLKILEKWVLNFKPDIKIFGVWKDEALEKYPDTFVKKAMSAMQETMWRSKYAFIPAFDKRAAFFVTPKPWEMIYYGILPFWDKNGYDTKNIYKTIPDYLKVSTPEEMWKKIEFLDNNPEEYNKLLEQIYNLLDDKYFKKEYVNEVFNPIYDHLKAAAQRSSEKT